MKELKINNPFEILIKGIMNDYVPKKREIIKFKHYTMIIVPRRNKK